jgi:4-diphosphocytidyl-2-C-methyl-D-erythritol kinase
MPTRVRSFSKINLGLAIGFSRGDGFHALTTLYQTLEAHDLVTVEARPAAVTTITLTATDPRVPVDNRNTVWKMADLALKTLKIQAEVHIHIDKWLPVQGGLGAGSANAVAALAGLERELYAHDVPPLPGPDRLRIAAEVGSDVPLFLIGGSVLGVGHGEEVYPLPDLPAVECVLALPEIGVSTPQAFHDWDALHSAAAFEDSVSRDSRAPIASWNPAPKKSDPPKTGSSLTRSRPSDRLIELSRALASALREPHSSGVFPLREDRPENPLLALVRTGIENDFEEVVFPKYPLLGEIKRALAYSSGPPDEAALYAALSGSGSALFGLYGNSKAAMYAEERLKAKGIRSLRTKTLPREGYWSTMLES